MFRNNNGFTLTETLIAITTLFISLAIIVPSFVLIQKERNELYNELAIFDSLRSKLIHIDDQENTFPLEISEKVNDKKVMYRFSFKNHVLKGCAIWESNRFENQQFCLYKQME